MKQKSSKNTTWRSFTKLIIIGAKPAHWESTVPLVMPGLWQVKELVMEVIKIPQEHVDSCLFFRPGGEGGRLPGRCTVLSARRTAGREWGGRRTWSKARERRGQMWEEWNLQGRVKGCGRHTGRWTEEGARETLIWMIKCENECWGLVSFTGRQGWLVAHKDWSCNRGVYWGFQRSRGVNTGFSPTVKVQKKFSETLLLS